MGIYMQNLQKIHSVVRRFSTGRNILHQKICHYEILGIPKNATKSQIRTAYLMKTKEFHPDSNIKDETLHNKFVKVTQAYEVLSNVHRRNLYDGLAHTNAYDQHQRYASTATNPFGTASQGEAWGNVDEETKRKIYEDFYRYTYPEYRAAMQEEYQKRRRKNMKIVYTTIFIALLFTFINFARILSHHRYYQQRMESVTAQNAAHLRDERSGYRALMRKLTSDKKE